MTETRRAGQLAELDDLRRQLCDAIGVPGPWLGQLRREVRAASPWPSRHTPTPWITSERWRSTPASDALAAGRGWPDRLAIALEQSVFGGVDRGGYAAEAGISLPTATADLPRLLDAGLVDSQGGGRNTRYVASAYLVDELA